MWHSQPSEIMPGLRILGSEVIPLYLVGRDPAILVEGGVTALTPVLAAQLEELNLAVPPGTDGSTAKNVKGNIGKLMLTHSHFDHCGAAPFLLDILPGLEAVASRETTEILGKEKVINFIERENRNLMKYFGLATEIGELNSRFRRFDLTPSLENGAVFSDWTSFGTMRIIAAPGHSSCSVSLWFPDNGLLIASDSCGFFGGPDSVFPFALNDFQRHQEDIERLRKLDPETVAFGHFGILTGRDVGKIFQRIKTASERLIEVAMKKSMEPEGKAAQIVEEFYRGSFRFLKRSMFLECTVKMISQIKMTQEN